jgi:hypothetical protein
MSGFVSNVCVGAGAFAGWFVAGFGPTLLLLPRPRRDAAFLLAPLVGLCLLGLTGLFEITVLLVPLASLVNLGVFALFSLGVCLWRRRAVAEAWRGFRRRHALSCLPPVALLLVFAWMFHKEGFQLLVGSSDQLQYCQNARHIAEQMHTGSGADVPIGRRDYFVYDCLTRLLPYSKLHRRGAEVMLALTVSLTRLSYEEAFPVTVLCSLLTLSLTLAFLGRVSFRLGPWACLALQLATLCSFYFLLLHVQGSLAMLLAHAQSLAALALLVRVTRGPSLRWLLLTALVVSSYLSFYNEPTLITLVVPGGLLALRQCWKSWRKGVGACLRLAAIGAVVVVVAPVAAYCFSYFVWGNLLAVRNGLSAAKGQAAAAATAAQPQPGIFTSPFWSLSAVVVGGYSYYDMTAFNGRWRQFLEGTPWVGCAAYCVLCGGALLGYLKGRTRTARIFAVVLAAWAGISFVMVRTQDYLRFARSLHYAMPFAIIGLVILASRYRPRRARFGFLPWGPVTWAGRIALVGFVLLNAVTGARTVGHLTSYNLENDPIVMRFDDRAAVWSRLRRELTASGDAPVLISGFPDTVRPLMIACGVRSHPHVLGDSILSFWRIYVLDILSDTWYRLNTRLSHDEYEAQLRQTKPCSEVHPGLIERSVQAAVPVGHGYPAEWHASADVFAPRLRRFPNICDVISRNEPAVVLSPGMTAALDRSPSGPFRLLTATGRLVVRDDDPGPHLLSLDYEGAIGDVELRSRGKHYAGQAAGTGGYVRIQARVSAADAADLVLDVARPVKLRAMAWTPLSP